MQYSDWSRYHTAKAHAIVEVMSLKSPPEYRAARKLTFKLIECARLDPNSICSHFFADDQISTEVRDFVRNKSTQQDEKAQKLIDTIVDRIEGEPNVFHYLVKILKGMNEPISMAVALQLEEKLKAITQEEVLNAKSESYQEQKDNDKQLEQNIEGIIQESVSNQEQKDNDNSSDESVYYTPCSSLTDSCRDNSPENGENVLISNYTCKIVLLHHAWYNY